MSGVSSMISKHTATPSGDTPALSIVIPFYNEAGNVDALLERLTAQMALIGGSFEIVGVDDGSRDATLAALIAACERVPEMRIVKLSRNFGKEAAMLAGIQEARGDRILLMDADLQHPPETIPAMLEVADRGVDVVYGARSNGRNDGWLRNTLSRQFYRIFASTAEMKIPADAGDFRLFSRRAADALRSLPETNRFMKGLYSWIGFSQESVPYDVGVRSSGSSKWPILKLFSYAWDGIISFSALPLRIWSVIGTVIATGALIYAMWIVISTLAFGRDIPGYATLASAIFFLGGLQLLSIGVLGEYIARIFAETKQRPIYIIEDIFGGTDDDGAK
ncbi:glycosyl transferase family protein [Hyphomonas oceanitis SCH89]|uniref:Glycosyl transferase family protein n=2 Tax=Hyphomonas oceanitis TaxID=81033 RepID=A0A059GCL8_9PROT|nr:glycosyl transferase family protein [Hyphomonas oceanitis SCH89]